MDKLNLSQPLVIVVTGLPGSGKTFFANSFATTFGAASVSNDKIRWTLFANHTYSENENAMVDQISDLLIAELLRTKRTFIIDGGYNSSLKRKHIEIIAKKAGFATLTVEVQTEPLTAKYRAKSRSAKNPCDKFKQSLKPEQFAKSVKSYEAPTIGQSSVVISGKHTAQTQLRTVLKKIVEMERNPAQEKKAPTVVSAAKMVRGKVFIQ